MCQTEAVARFPVPSRSGGRTQLRKSYVIEEACRNVLAKAPDAMPGLERVLRRVKTPAARRVDAALEESLPLPARGRLDLRLRCVTCIRALRWRARAWALSRHRGARRRP